MQPSNAINISVSDIFKLKCNGVNSSKFDYARSCPVPSVQEQRILGKLVYEQFQPPFQMATVDKLIIFLQGLDLQGLGHQWDTSKYCRYVILIYWIFLLNSDSWPYPRATCPTDWLS